MHRPSIKLLLVILLAICTISPGCAVEIRGELYEWGNYKILQNTIVNINSTPEQSIVATNGTYNFDVEPGVYNISASYYGENNLAYYNEEKINLIDNESYVLDIVLFPVVSMKLQNESINNTIKSSETNKKTFSGIVLLSDILVILIAIGVIRLIWFKHKKEKFEDNRDNLESIKIGELSDNLELNEEIDDLVEQEEYDDEIPKGPISPELEEIIEVIRSHGGRMTQKDLRGRIKYSEAKVSLMLFELEKRGIIQKFKKGRGNVILLVDENEWKQADK